MQRDGDYEAGKQWWIRILLLYIFVFAWEVDEVQMCCTVNLEA